MATYPKELEDLIQEYLTDGIITDSERRVLLRKAENLGLDVEEVNLYIDAQQQKMDQQVDAASSKKRGQTCPYCGGSIPQLADKCPHCGQQITAEASDELKDIIDHLEEALIDFKSGKDIEKSKAMVERYVRKAKMYYESNPKVQKLLSEIQTESERATAEAKKNARNKTIVKLITYNKWLTGAVIVLFIWAIWTGIAAIKEAVSSPDPTEDAQACILVIRDAISDGDVTKAEAVRAAYKWSTWDISEGTALIVDYYLENGNLEKAQAMAKNLNYDQRDVYKAKICDAYIEKGEYEKAENAGVSGYVSKSDIPLFTRIIKHMKKSGYSNSEIKAYIEGVAVRAYSHEKDEVKTALTALINN